MAKDDNMILLITGLLQQICRNEQIWLDEPKIVDLFGMSGGDEDYVQIISNLLTIFEIRPQYFRFFTLHNCMNVINHFYVQD